MAASRPKRRVMNAPIDSSSSGRRGPRDPAADDRRVENGDWGLVIGGWIDHGCHAVLRYNQSLITNPPNPQSPIPVAHRRARTMSSSIAMNVGDVLSDSVRRSVV